MSSQFSSARHQAALSTPTGYRRFSRFSFSRSGRTVEMEPVSGSFTQDARRGGRWDGRLTFAGTSLLPTRPSDILTPFGTRVEVEFGLELLDGSVSSVPFGTYEISSSRTRTEANQRVVEIGLIDISDRIERYRFETSLTVAAGTDLGNVINAVVTNRTGINPNVSLVGVSLGSARVFGLDAGTAPWSELLDVLNGFSRTAWYDRVGHIQVGTVTPDPAGAYPLDLLTSISADYDTRPPNVIVARGEAQDGTPPVQAVALDSDPSSPTYAGAGPGTSPYGRVTEYFSSPLILSVAQAQAAADTLLAQNIGAGATYTLVRPYDPTITAGDVVAVGGATLIVDAVTLDLTGDTSLAVREL
jgi:hypothetical protein